jgi:NAD-dependent deacetylase
MVAGDLEAARRRLRPGRRITCFSGAGLSAESGVPTFRDAAEDALWRRYDPMRLASPEGFAADPMTVIDWYAWRRRAVAAAEPNAAHRALAGRTDIAQVTQNVDDLLERAGAQVVTHLHGTITRDRCHAGCGHSERIDLAAPPALRACPRCGAPLRPAVVWFGEALQTEDLQRAVERCQCDVLLVVGTSATVHPAAGLIDVARSAGAEIVIVNTAPSEASDRADLELLGPAGAILPAILREAGAP